MLFSSLKQKITVSLQKIIRTIHYLSGLNRTRDRIIQNPPLLREHALHIYISSKQNHNEYEMDSNHSARFYRE